ncbi:MAG: hypothetical protein PHD72_02530 [Patescibacteria group bacterium]|nr:hypothetical protein [Patescibacteria group bacterium]
MNPLILTTPFGFNIDLSFWQNFFAMPQPEMNRAIFAMVGWWILVLLFFKIAAEVWMAMKQREYMATWEWVVLAVDIPAQFVQSPKAMEQVFAHLSGSFVPYDIQERYWKGLINKWYSFEIISIEGYIQFVIRVETQFRDLVEAAIYAQYSEAEITEVEDYVGVAPDVYPNTTHDVQGVEFNLTENEVYPIRTYPYFEYNISKDVVFSDPMAALLENFSRIGPGENLWFQLVITPVDSSWKKDGIDLVKKIIAGKKEIKSSAVVSFIGDLPMMAAKTAMQAWNSKFDEEDDKKKGKKEEPAGKVSDLTPGAKLVVESIEEKISKIGFKSRLRILYTAKKDVFQPNKCVSGVVGAMNQFSINNRNSFKPKPVGGANKSLVGSNIVAAFKERKLKKCYRHKKLKPLDKPFILNIEELATVWHFPLPLVKTPLLQKSLIKRSEPPINLPVENFEAPLKAKPVGPKFVDKPREINPEDLPYA